MHGPVIRTLPLGPEEGLRAATEAVIEHPPDDVVASTGIGIRSWFSAAESWGRDAQLLGALSHGRFLARGPKAAAALQTVGFEPAWRAPGERLSEVVEHLVADGVDGRRVVLQQAGDGDSGAAATLRSAGADVVEVPVYRWTDPLDNRPAHRLIDAACRGALQAVTFTTAPAVDAFFRFATDDDRTAALLHALNGPVTVACVGPVCAEAARAAGVRAPVEPRPARLGAMVRALTESLVDRRLVLDASGHVVEVQGSTVIVDGAPAHVGDPERLLLETLAGARGRVVDHLTLMHAAWPVSDPDAHRLEAAVARLRRQLGPAARALTTVRRRGYRLDAPRHQPHGADPSA